MQSTPRLDSIIALAMVAAHKISLSLAEYHVSEMDTQEKQQRFQMYIEHGILDRENWYPACGCTEVPFLSRSGLRLLYCWQPSTGKHAYINLDTDIALTDEEALHALCTF